MIDIEEMIGKRRYRVSLPPEEIFTRIDTFFNPEIHSSLDIKEWNVTEHGERFRNYLSNFLVTYVVISSYTKNGFDLKKVEKARKNFYEKNLSDEILKGLRDSAPVRLHILIRKEDELGCECEGFCHTALYTKLSKGIVEEEQIKNFQITESRISSLLFLDQIFIGVLGGEVIEEVTDDLELKLLLNDSGTREITNIIDKLFDEATTEVLICGWVGTHYIPKLRDLKSKGVNVKFITHKPGEARGQPWKSEVEEAYRSLCSDFGLDKISNAHNIHGRTIVVDNKALIGTMDLNSSSLTGTHTEFAILTNNPDIVRRMRAIFNAKFEPLSESE